MKTSTNFHCNDSNFLKSAKSRHRNHFRIRGSCVVTLKNSTAASILSFFGDTICSLPTSFSWEREGDFAFFFFFIGRDVNQGKKRSKKRSHEKKMLFSGKKCAWFVTIYFSWGQFFIFYFSLCLESNQLWIPGCPRTETARN